MSQGNSVQRRQWRWVRPSPAPLRRAAPTGKRCVQVLGSLLALVTLMLAGGLAAAPVAARGIAGATGSRGSLAGSAATGETRANTGQGPTALTIPPDPSTNFIPFDAPSPQVSEAYLFDPATGKVLFSENANTEQAMASTTKIMTAYVALHVASPNQVITVGPDAVAMEDGIASVAGLRLGDQLTLHDLLYCLMLPSGDDAAVAIAEGVAGTQARFVALMNLEASLLGLGRTHYMNPHGLDQQGHYTTAHDLAVLTAYAMQNPLFRQIVSTPTYIIPATSQHQQYVLTNTNDLLSTMQYPGVLGVKTGFTGNAGYCLDFAAKHGQDELIGVVLGEPSYDGRFIDATNLLNWGFGQLAPEQASTPGTEGQPTTAATPTPPPATPTDTLPAASPTSTVPVATATTAG